MAAWYNENDHRKAAWLRQLIEEGAIAPGVVDERSIHAVEPADIAGFEQCHFFAGIGVWSHAFRRAGWPDDEPAWTGSCPCGPFSVAGVQAGFDDPRHLWPEWFRLIGERRPHVLFGEQVDAADAWIDLISADLEGIGYAFGSPDLPAAGFGGAHGRQRFFWVADADHAEWWSGLAPWHDGAWPKARRVKGDGDAATGGGLRWLADTDSEPGAESLLRTPAGQSSPRRGDAARRGDPGGLADAESRGRGVERHPLGAGSSGHADGASLSLGLGDPGITGLSDAKFGIIRRAGGPIAGRTALQSGDPSGTGVDWLLCRDRRWRPVESGTCPLVDASPARMGRLRGYGDAIDAEVATEFVSAYMAVLP